MGDTTVLSCKTDTSLQERVDEYADRQNTSRNQALDELLRVGLREREGPIRERWRERCFDFSLLLLTMAVMSVALGFLPLVRMSASVQFSAVSIALGLAIIGLAEFGRVLTGQSATAAAVLEVLR